MRVAQGWIREKNVMKMFITCKMSPALTVRLIKLRMLNFFLKVFCIVGGETKKR